MAFFSCLLSLSASTSGYVGFTAPLLTSGLHARVYLFWNGAPLGKHRERNECQVVLLRSGRGLFEAAHQAIVSITKRMQFKKIMKWEGKAALGGSAELFWWARNNQGRKGLAACAPLLDCAVEFLKLPGSIWDHNKTPAKSWQEVSRRFAVESCALLCKTERPLQMHDIHVTPLITQVFCYHPAVAALRRCFPAYLRRRHGLFKPAHQAMVFIAHRMRQPPAKFGKELPRVCQVQFPIIGIHAE
jgi:hypothetical protein